MSWLPAFASDMTEIRQKPIRLNQWKHGEQQVDFAQPMVLILNRKPELPHAGYTISGRFAGPKLSPIQTQQIDCIREGRPEIPTNVLWEFVSSYFSGKWALEE